MRVACQKSLKSKEKTRKLNEKKRSHRSHQKGAEKAISGGGSADWPGVDQGCRTKSLWRAKNNDGVILDLEIPVVKRKRTRGHNVSQEYKKRKTTQKRCKGVRKPEGGKLLERGLGERRKSEKRENFCRKEDSTTVRRV